MTELRIGFIPLADAATLLVAVIKGFCAGEGLEVEFAGEDAAQSVITGVELHK